MSQRVGCGGPYASDHPSWAEEHASFHKTVPARSKAADLDPKPQKRGNNPSIQPRGNVVEDDAPACGKALQLPRGERLGNVEEPEKDERDESMAPVGRAAKQGDPLAGYLIDDHEPWIVAAALTCGDGGGGHAKAH